MVLNEETDAPGAEPPGAFVDVLRRGRPGRGTAVLRSLIFALLGAAVAAVATVLVLSNGGEGQFQGRSSPSVHSPTSVSGQQSDSAVMCAPDQSSRSDANPTDRNNGGAQRMERGHVSRSSFSTRTTHGGAVWNTPSAPGASRTGRDWCGTTIAECGCAATSLANVLALFPAVSSPLGSELNPDTLNTWLNRNARFIDGQGFISNGYFLGEVMWSDIQRSRRIYSSQTPRYP